MRKLSPTNQLDLGKFYELPIDIGHYQRIYRRIFPFNLHRPIKAGGQGRLGNRTASA